MKNEEHPLSAYDFDFVGGASNIFTFTTLHTLKYEVRFIPTFYLFEEDKVLNEQVFELIITTIDPDVGAIPFDNLTGLTISAIINDFYTRSPLTITLFICDDSDRRQLARHRKFSSWFTAYNSDKFIKFDFKWKDEGEKIIYISVIITIGNPDISVIKKRFEILSNAFRQDK